MCWPTLSRTTENAVNFVNPFPNLMAPIIILLLPLFITNGVHAAEIITESDYRIQYPCKKVVCYSIWKPSSFGIAIVSNGEIQKTTSITEEPKCTLPVGPFTAKDVGRHHCRRNPLIYLCEESPNCATVVSLSSIQPIKMLPGKKVSLHCVLLSSLDSATCFTHLYGLLVLQWVDENDNPVRDDSEYHITQHSPCDVTLTVALQSPKSVTFKCKAAVNAEMWTSSEVKVKLPAPKGKGRGIIIDSNKPKPGGGDQRDQSSQSNQDVVGTVVGVLGAVVLTTAAAVFVVKKRRTNTRLPNDSHTSSANYALNSDDVIYADIILPATSDRVCVPQSEPTEYACVRYT